MADNTIATLHILTFDLLDIPCQSSLFSSEAKLTIIHDNVTLLVPSFDIASDIDPHLLGVIVDRDVHRMAHTRRIDELGFKKI